ncbi:MAG: hypothetical protein PHU64_04180 [Candidatus Omnitrophica bacterium]|nr:hypothetical protein [Candidatus Omnitrophota bacterium]MDD5429256.1 hypothetical protein [Candidatus Omnitrophota bacterium]
MRARDITKLFLLLTFACVTLDLSAESIYYKGKISPYRILQKSQAALYGTKAVTVKTEQWQQGEGFHAKAVFENIFQDYSDQKIVGRGSFSFYGLAAEENFSSSFWVQSYRIDGVPFSWDSEDKVWENKALDIEEKRTREKFKYDFMKSLLFINAQSVDLKGLLLEGEENKNGHDCYRISYRYEKGMFKSWGLAGALGATVWISKEDFLPVKQRIEGNVGGKVWVQEIGYTGYDSLASLEAPEEIIKEAQEEKAALKDKISTVISEVADIRGWKASDIKDVKVEFVKSNRMRELMLQEISRYYSEEDIENEGLIMKCLGLIPEEADYRDIIFNSTDAALVLGMYVPDEKAIFIRDDIQPSFAEIVCAHEAVHAFQDKKLNLSNLKQKMKGDFDASMALRCMIEGEASDVQLEYLLRKDDETLRDWQDITSLVEKGVIGNAYIRDKLFYNAYGYGARLIQLCLQSYDWDWKKLDALYKKYPRTSEEVMHPQEYVMRLTADLGDLVSDKSKETLQVSLPKGWKKSYSTRLGEYVNFLFLSKALDSKYAHAGSIGWENDSAIVCENESAKSKIVVFAVKWDSPKDAKEFADTFKAFLDKEKYSEIKSESGKGVLLYGKDTSKFSYKIFSNYSLAVWAQGIDEGEITEIMGEISFNIGRGGV